MPTVDLTPPFSEHLFRDFGGATLGLAVVLTAAAVWMERRLVVIALLAYLAFSAPHLVFHLGHLHGPGGPAAAALVAVLAGSVAFRWRCSPSCFEDRPRRAPPRAREHVGRTST